MTAFIALVLAIQADAQGPAADFRKGLEPAAEYFTDAQMRALAERVASTADRAASPEARAKLWADSREYVLSRASSGTVVVADPQHPDGPRTQAHRPESSWALFQHELGLRLDYALRHPRREEDLRGSRSQIDALAVAVRTRVRELCEGPEADRYAERCSENFTRYMSYYAGSDLEYVFRGPLPPHQLGELEAKIRGFQPGKVAPAKPRDPAKDPGPGKVWAGNAADPSPEMRRLFDFGIFAVAQNYVTAKFKPDDFYDDRYRELQQKSALEMEELSTSLDRDTEARPAPAGPAARDMRPAEPSKRTLSPEAPDARPDRPAPRAPADIPPPSPANRRLLVSAAVLVAAAALLLALSRRKKRSA
jgi:hypothetical protein